MKLTKLVSIANELICNEGYKKGLQRIFSVIFDTAKYEGKGQKNIRHLVSVELAQ